VNLLHGKTGFAKVGPVEIGEISHQDAEDHFTLTVQDRESAEMLMQALILTGRTFHGLPVRFKLQNLA
jgi:hypothetical protein